MKCLGLMAALVLISGCTLNDRYDESARDPVCGRSLEKKSAPETRTYLRKAYYFDSDACARSFDEHPARYCDVNSAMYPNYDY